MPESYHVRIEKERLVFSAAHFITYAGDVCEPLHGHNYHVYAEVHGPLDENHYVVDFIALRDALQKIVDALDHRVLLPTSTRRSTSPSSPAAKPAKSSPPTANAAGSSPGRTACCCRGQHDGRTAGPAHRRRNCSNRWAQPAPTSITRLEIGVDECDGQWGVYRYLAPGHEG